MTIEEVRALIATPMNNEAVKSAYLFSCFCGLRVSDIVGLKWKDVFVDRWQYRLAVSMQKTKEPIYLSHCPSHFCHDDADTRCGSLYHFEVTRSCRCENDASVRQNHQPEKGRCRQFGKRIVRLAQCKSGYWEGLCVRCFYIRI